MGAFLTRVRVEDMRKLFQPIQIILTSQALISMIFVFNRIIDADEGFYLAAAQRVADGMLPYHDFFFPQMPLLPFTFFGLSGWGINSLLVLRIIAAVAGILTTYTMFRIVADNLKNLKLANIAAFLVAFSGLSLNWHTTFKPYAFVDLFLLASFGLLLKARSEDSRFEWSVFASMLALGLAINFRSIFAVLIPVYGYFFFTALPRHGATVGKTTLFALAGLMIPSLPALYLVASGFDQFWFNNLIFHLHREPISPFSALIIHKLENVAKFLILPQTVLLLGMVLASIYFLRSKLVSQADIYRPATAVALVIFAVYTIPTPTHLQYFQQTLPYLIILALPTAEFFRRYDSSKLITASAGLIYLVGIFPFVYLFMVSPREQDLRTTWPHIESVISRIEEETFPSDTLLTEWAGYGALSGRKQLPGSEHVGFYFPLEVDRQVYRDNHLLTNSDIVTALDERRPRMVVIDYQIYPEWEPSLKANYNLIEKTGDTFLYKRNEAL